jgi:hypothetical protein
MEQEKKERGEEQKEREREMHFIKPKNVLYLAHKCYLTLDIGFRPVFALSSYLNWNRSVKHNLGNPTRTSSHLSLHYCLAELNQSATHSKLALTLVRSLARFLFFKQQQLTAATCDFLLQTQPAHPIRGLVTNAPFLTVHPY